MPRVTFIYPSVGRFQGTRYVRSWQMQPLAIAALSHLTPDTWDRDFYDDRLERMNYDQPTDIVAISIETFTARRGYQIADEFRKRKVPVIMGGYHATFRPDEVLRHADAVCIGEAEAVWPSVLEDVRKGTLKDRYENPPGKNMFAGFDRSIFKGKRYFKLALVETSRGCSFKCNFCSITAFHQGRCRHRSIGEIVDEIRGLAEPAVFIVDDNIVADLDRARELFTALCDLDVQWIGQASINLTRHVELLDLAARSGCVGLLIGFESLNREALACINKGVNQHIDYSAALAALRARGIVIYGTFLLGLPSDTSQTVDRLTTFAIREKIFIAAFNHIVPFPGTPLYNRLKRLGQLPCPDWWLSETYRFGDAPFEPQCGSNVMLREWCHTARLRFYNWGSILKRAMEFRANCGSLRKGALFFGLNFMLRREIHQKRGLPLGIQK